MSDGLSDQKGTEKEDHPYAPTKVDSVGQSGADGSMFGAALRAGGAEGAVPADPVPSVGTAGEVPATAAGTTAGMVGSPTVAAAALPASPGVLGALRQFFWMEERLAQAKREGYYTGHPGWEEFELGRSVLADANQLGESGEGQSAALLLYRAAASLMIRAHLARAKVELEPTLAADVCWTRLSGLPIGNYLASVLSEEQRALVTAGLGVGGESFLAKLPKDKRSKAAQGLRKLAQGLMDPLEGDAKRVGSLLVTRWLRIVIVSIALLAVGWLAASKLSARPNLALHRPVTVVTPSPIWGKDPSQLVDGDLTNLGFHTTGDTPNQYVTIDLGSVLPITRVVVYNRADCCQERAIPCKLEISEDGKSFQHIADRTEPFERWQANFPKTRARYVRLINPRAVPFHLSEVEVY